MQEIDGADRCSFIRNTTYVLEAAALLALFLALLVSPTSGPLIRTAEGPIVGRRRRDGTVAFRGIPYAKPPVGNLRWRPPQPIRWRAPLEAVNQGTACPQSEYGAWNHRDALRGREDCLTLGVRTPSLQSKSPLPVMVWIHGGGNRAGSGMDALETNIVTKGFVFVEFNYRLGILGFLSHPGLSAETRGRTSGNYGLMDQQAALSWVQRNIARFGGDPARVTLFGGSAGAQDTGLHLLMPGSRDLIQRAIEESGTPEFGLPTRSLSEAEALGERLAALAGAPAHADARALRSLPLRRLLQAADSISVPGLGDNSLIWLQMTVDGAVLPASPQRLLGVSRDRRPLIIGTNAVEFATSDVTADPVASIQRRLANHASEVIAAYRTSSPRQDLATAFSTDLLFRCPTHALARTRAAGGAPVWLYRFDRSSQEGEPVRHGSEVSSVLFPPRGKSDIQAYWLNFARTGDPNGGALPFWPRHDVQRRSQLVFRDGDTSAENAPDTLACTNAPRL